jgi:DNA-binding transcriptional ArsR family regulator
MHADNNGLDDLPIEQAELAVEVFRMLSDTTRVRLLWALIDQELAVNELAARVGKPGPSVSQHLAKLRMARLVRTRQEGTQVFYRLENEHVARLVRDGVYNAEHAGPEVPRHHVVERLAPQASLPRSRSGVPGSPRAQRSWPAEPAPSPPAPSS